MLKRHVEPQHNEKKYDCDQCKFEAKSFDQLKNHKGINHEGMRYDCDNCEAGFTSPRGLNITNKPNMRDIVMIAICVMLNFIDNSV